MAVKKKRKTIRPLGEMVLIRHDKDKGVTDGGILLPDTAKERLLTGRVVAIPERMREDQLTYPFEELDWVLYDVREGIPVSLDPRNTDYLVPAEYLYAVVEEEEVEVPDEVAERGVQ